MLWEPFENRVDENGHIFFVVCVLHAAGCNCSDGTVKVGYAILAAITKDTSLSVLLFMIRYSWELAEQPSGQRGHARVSKVTGSSPSGGR